jgi:hypothetical protein
MVALGIAQSRTIGSSGIVPIKSRVSKIEAQIAKWMLVNSNCEVLGG